ncbi:hypothetical protein ES703_83183 [subsurface metagenome]
MNEDKPTSEGKETINMFRWPRCRTVRDPDEVGSIKLIWGNDYPKGVKGKKNERLSLLAKVGMTLLLVRTYIDWGYGLRRVIIRKERESAFIEWYVLGRLMVLLIFLIVSWSSPCAKWIVAGLVGWEIIGLILIPLRITLVDRLAEDWKPKSYERSFVLVLVNYFEMVVAFAYFYRHFGLAGYSSGDPIKTVGEALYFSVVTITTLGYGDIEPVTIRGRVLASAEPILGIILLVLVLGIFLVELGRQKYEQKQ